MDKLIVGFGRATLCIAMLASLAACGGGGDSNTASSPPVATVPDNPPPSTTPPVAEQPPADTPESPPPVVQIPPQTPPVVTPPEDEAPPLPTPQLQSVTLSWTPPTENTDGSALTNLSGYEIHYGKQSGHYDQTVTVNNAGLTRYVVESLEPGKYFFVLTALTSKGAKSNFSGEVSKTL